MGLCFSFFCTPLVYSLGILCSFFFYILLFTDKKKKINTENNYLVDAFFSSLVLIQRKKNMVFYKLNILLFSSLCYVFFKY